MIDVDLGLWGPHAALAWWTIAVGAIVNSACAILGCFLILRRLSLLGDAISHAVLPGIVVAFLLAGRSSFFGLFIGALATGILTTFFIQTLARFGGVGEDAGMGVVFTALFSIGVLLLTRFAREVHLDASCIIFGEIEYIPLDLINVAGISVPRVLPSMLFTLALTIGFVSLFWKELKLAAFDPALAVSLGYSASLLHYLLMAMTAVVTVTAFEAVGSILVVAMLVVPPATASLLTDRLPRMIGGSVLVAVASSFLGYVAAVVWQANVAGMTAVAAGGLFALAVLFAPRYGLISKAWNSLRLSIRIIGEDLAAALFRDEEAGTREPGDGIASRELLRRAGGGISARLALRQLLDRGDLALLGGNQVALTPQGRATAESLVRSHRLWEAYLVENFQLPLDHLHDPAEKIEHFIGPELQKELAQSLPEDKLDPHGREIPPPRAS